MDARASMANCEALRVGIASVARATPVIQALACTSKSAGRSPAMRRRNSAAGTDLEPLFPFALHALAFAPRVPLRAYLRGDLEWRVSPPQRLTRGSDFFS